MNHATKRAPARDHGRKARRSAGLTGREGGQDGAREPPGSWPVRSNYVAPPRTTWDASTRRAGQPAPGTSSAVPAESDTSWPWSAPSRAGRWREGTSWGLRGLCLGPGHERAVRQEAPLSKVLLALAIADAVGRCLPDSRWPALPRVSYDRTHWSGRRAGERAALWESCYYGVGRRRRRSAWGGAGAARERQGRCRRPERGPWCACLGDPVCLPAR